MIHNKAALIICFLVLLVISLISFATGDDTYKGKYAQVEDYQPTDIPFPSLNPESKPSENPSQACPNCGYIAASKFCPECGTQMPTPTPVPTPILTPKPTSIDLNAPVDNVVKMPFTIQFFEFNKEYFRDGLFTGETINGIPHGYGIFVSHNSEGVEWHYIGNWEYGLPNGECACYWESGKVLQGNYSNNVITVGTFTAPGISGEWLDDYDSNGNQHFISYYNRFTKSKFAEGYSDISQHKIVEILYYDEEGNITDSPHLPKVNFLSFCQ